jgi:hypothetical protein
LSTSPAEAIGNRAIVRRSFGQLADASLGVATTPVEVLNESQIEQGFAALGAAHAIRYDIGTVSTSPAFSRAGVLASYSADFAAVASAASMPGAASAHFSDGRPTVGNQTLARLHFRVVPPVGLEPTLP